MLAFSVRALALAVVPKLGPRFVQSLQQKRLKSLVRLAVERSPHFRKKYQGIELSRLSLTDLPPSNKAELMANFDSVVTDRRLKRAGIEQFIDNPENEGLRYLGQYIISHTSGSQGQPMLVVQQPRHLELLFSFQMTRGNLGKVGPAEAIRRLRQPERMAAILLGKDFFPTASTFQNMPVQAQRYVKLRRFAQTDPRLVDALNEYRPTIITAYASVLESLALEAQAGRLKLEPELRQLVSNSEVLTDRARARIEGTFGIRVLNNYATGECTFLTTGCRQGRGAHVNADWVILEVVDGKYQPVPNGTPGRKVLITNLANTVLPFIRYEIGDVATMGVENCGCGNRFPRVEHIAGRDADAFWINDGPGYRRVISIVFSHAFEFLREVREWQAIQTERNRVEVRLELIPGASYDPERTRHLIHRELSEHGYQGLLEVEVKVVPRLLPDPKTGKFQRMISRVGLPDDPRRVAAAIG